MMNKNFSLVLSFTLFLTACGGGSSSSSDSISDPSTDSPAFSIVVTDSTTCTYGVLSNSVPIDNVLIEQGQSITNVNTDAANNPTGTEIDLSAVSISTDAVVFVNAEEGADVSAVPDNTRLDAFPECPLITGLPFSVGDTGPAGGTVIYVADDGTRGLEVAPERLVGFYGCTGMEIPGADGTEIGAGQQNSNDILANCDEPDILARQADRYSFGGFSDWFLASRDETIAQPRLSNFCCMSSSEIDANLVWGTSTSSGTGVTLNKNFTFPSGGPAAAFPVRAF